MSLPATIPAAILDTILAHLASLFLIGAGGDTDLARQAALRMLVRQNPRSEEELCLAADIVSFELHGLEALKRSDDPELPITRVLQLRGSAVRLNKEARQCRDRLKQMQAADPAPAPDLAPPRTEPMAADTSAEAAFALIDEALQAMPAPPRNAGKQGRYGGLTYSQALSKRMMAARINQNQKRRAAEHAAAQLAAARADCAPSP